MLLFIFGYWNVCWKDTVNIFPTLTLLILIFLFSIKIIYPISLNTKFMYNCLYTCLQVIHGFPIFWSQAFLVKVILYKRFVGSDISVGIYNSYISICQQSIVLEREMQGTIFRNFSMPHGISSIELRKIIQCTIKKVVNCVFLAYIPYSFF